MLPPDPKSFVYGSHNRLLTAIQFFRDIATAEIMPKAR
jgi:hypothetical protein